MRLRVYRYHSHVQLFRDISNLKMPSHCFISVLNLQTHKNEKTFSFFVAWRDGISLKEPSTNRKVRFWGGSRVYSKHSLHKSKEEDRMQREARDNRGRTAFNTYAITEEYTAHRKAHNSNIAISHPSCEVETPLFGAAHFSWGKCRSTGIHIIQIRRSTDWSRSAIHSCPIG